MLKLNNFFLKDCKIRSKELDKIVDSFIEFTNS